MTKEIETKEDADEIMSAINRYRHQTNRFHIASEQIAAAVRELNDLRMAIERDVKIMKEYEIYSTSELIEKLTKATAKND